VAANELGHNTGPHPNGGNVARRCIGKEIPVIYPR
jgi:hypothetical protein